MQFLSFQKHNERFESLLSHVKMTQLAVGSSAASVTVIQNDSIVAEWYSGHHHAKNGARPVTSSSQFNVYSVRKTYIGLALAIVIAESKLNLDAPVDQFIDDIPTEELATVTIRHVLTKTKPKFFGPDKIEGEGLAARVVKKVTGKTISQILRERILGPMKLFNTEWIAVPNSDLVCDYTAGYPSLRMESDEGHERNLYVSTRDLAFWAYLHLNKGVFNGEQLVPKEVFNIIQELRSTPGYENKRILGWYFDVDSFAAAGATGCFCISVPDYNAVAVRMYNMYNLSEEEYTEELNVFKQTLVNCLDRCR